MYIAQLQLKNMMNSIFTYVLPIDNCVAGKFGMLGPFDFRQICNENSLIIAKIAV